MVVEEEEEGRKGGEGKGEEQINPQLPKQLETVLKKIVGTKIGGGTNKLVYR